MKGKELPAAEDIDLFRQTVGEVKPVTYDRVPPHTNHRAPRLRRHLHRDFPPAEAPFVRDFIPEAHRVSPVDTIEFRRTGLQERVFRRLRRGQIPIEAELDLHGMTTAHARALLTEFMAEMAKVPRQICIRIIHGKGFGSRDGQPVIKQQLQGWLQDEPAVLAYVSCLPEQGGTGAVYVLIRAARAGA